MARFEEGKTYSGRFVCNADRFVHITIERRTSKMVKFTLHGRRQSCKIRQGSDSEQIRPLHGVTIDAKRELQS